MIRSLEGWLTLLPGRPVTTKMHRREQAHQPLPLRWLTWRVALTVCQIPLSLVRQPWNPQLIPIPPSSRQTLSLSKQSTPRREKLKKMKTALSNKKVGGGGRSSPSSGGGRSNEDDRKRTRSWPNGAPVARGTPFTIQMIFRIG